MKETDSLGILNEAQQSTQEGEDRKRQDHTKEEKNNSIKVEEIQVEREKKAD